jgi:hypothetical protein
MNSPCETTREKIADFVLGILSAEESDALTEHLSRCPECRKFAQALQDEKRSLIQLGESLDRDMDAREAKVIEALNQSVQGERAKPLPIWRTIMKNRITKLAAAAVIIVAVVLLITLFDVSAPTAYALEQTIEASHSIRCVQLKWYMPPDNLRTEFWLKYDENGNLHAMRRDIYTTQGVNYDTIVWKQDETKFWKKRENKLFIFNDEIFNDKMLRLAKVQDPRTLAERVQRNKSEKQVQIEIEEPSNELEPIVITATYPDKRFVLFVDQSTKLVTSWESYILKDGEYRFDQLMKYCSYNAVTEPSIFTLDDELPDDITVINRTLDLEPSPNRKLVDKQTLEEVHLNDLLSPEFRVEQQYEDSSESEKQSMIQQWIMDAQCGNFESKTRAIAALGNVRAQEALDVLIEIAAANMECMNCDNRHRWMAVRALGRIADPVAIPTLIDLLDHYNRDTARYARVALAEIAGVYFGKNKTKWGQWWEQNKEDFNF